MKKFLKLFKRDENQETTKIQTVKVDISNKFKDEVLASLYNFGVEKSAKRKNYLFIEIWQAREYLEQTDGYIESINRFPIEIDFKEDIIDVTIYDQIYGEGSAEWAISICHDKK